MSATLAVTDGDTIKVLDKHLGACCRTSFPLRFKPAANAGVQMLQS